MATFIVLYDGGSSGNHDGDWREVISAIGPAWFGIGSTAIVHTASHTLDQLTDMLRPQVNEHGKCLIVKSGVEHASLGLDARDVDLVAELL